MFLLYTILFIFMIVLLGSMFISSIALWELERNKIRLVVDIIIILLLLTFSISYFTNAIDARVESTFDKMTIIREN